MPDLAELNLVINSQQVKEGTRELNIMITAAKEAEKEKENLSRASDRLGNSFASLTKLISILTAGYLTMKTASDAFKAAANYEASEASFKILLKSAGDAKNMMQDLADFARDAPFETPGLIDASKRLLAFGFDAKQVIPILRSVGDTAAALDLGEDGMDRIISSLGMIIERGKVTQRELSGLGMMGINAFGYIADAAHRSEDEIRMFSKRGMLDAKESVNAILVGMQRDFAGGMETQGNLTKGLLVRLKSAVQDTLRDIGLAFIEGFGVKPGMQNTLEWIRAMGSIIVDVARVLAGLEPKWESNRKLAQALADYISGIWPGIKQGWLTIEEVVVTTWTRIKNTVLGVIDSIRGAIATVLELAAKLVDKIPGMKGDTNYLKAFAMSGVVGLPSALAMSQGNSVGTDLRSMAADLRAPSGEIGDVEKIRAEYNAIRAQATTGLLQDIRSTLMAAGAKIPGMGSLLETKGNVINEMNARAARQQQPLEGGTVRPRPSEEMITSGLDELDKMSRKHDEELATALMSRENAEKYNTVLKMQEVVKKHLLDMDDAAAAKANTMIERYKAEFEQLQRMREIRKLAEDMGNAFGDAFQKFIEGSASSKEILQSLLKDLENAVFQAAVRKPLQDFLTNSLANIMGGAAKGIFGGGASSDQSLFNSKNDWDLVGTTSAHALGDVVDTPSFFRTNNGRMNVAGEAGPEVIAPLARGPGGEMGVKVFGGGEKREVHNHFNIKVMANNPSEFRSSSRQMASDVQRITRGT